MASRELKVEIIGDASSLQKALGKVDNSSSKLGSSLKSMGKMAAVGLGALGVGAVVAGKKMIDMASDAAEVDSKLEVTFGKTLPSVTKEIEKFSEATGASRFAMREQAADMGALLVPLTANKKAAADMSTQFVELATDLGSFNNVPVEEALLAIRSGLVGEAEPLRRFGVLLNEAAVKAEAYSSGIAKSGAELTEQQKVQARANLIMEQTTLAQGDATRTADSMSNQMKRLKNSLTDAATEMGMKLLPAATAVVTAFNQNWPEIEKIVDRVMDALITGAGMAVSAVRTHFNTIKTVITTAIGGAKTAIEGLANFFRSDFGQQVAIGAGSFLLLSKAMAGILVAAKAANTGLLLVKANPLWAALIPLGFALGKVAEHFIESKIEAANAAAAWDNALDAANRLKSALSGVEGAQIAVRQATLDARNTHGEHVRSVVAAKDALLEYGSNSEQYRTALKAEEQASINADAAALRLRDSKAALNAKTGETKAVSAEAASAILEMAGTMDKASGASKSIAQVQGLQTREADAYVKKLRELLPAQDNIARKYRESEPALAAQAEKTAALARRLIELANETKKVPSKKDIIAEAKLIGGPAFAKAVQGIITGADKSQKGAKKALDKIPGHVETAIAAGETAASGASSIATTITSGIESGFNFGGIIATVRRGVQAAIAAGRNAGSTTESIAKPIGKDITTGAGKGVEEGTEKLKEVTAASVRAAVGAARLAAATKEIGSKAVQDIIDGIVGKTPSLKAQFATAAREAAAAAKQALIDARAGYASAFAALFDAGAAAIAAKYAGWVPPSLLKAQREAEEREKAALEKTIQDTADAMTAAVKKAADAAAALQSLGATSATSLEGDEWKKMVPEGIDPEEWKKQVAAAQAALKEAGPEFLAAQKANDDALFQQRQKALADAAIEEQKEHDKMIAKEQGNFAKRLRMIMREGGNIHAKVMALLKEYNIDYLLAGEAWGNQLAQGLRNAVGEVESAADELAGAVKQRTKPKNSPAEKGPLSTFDMFDAGRQFGTDWADGMASAAKDVRKAANTTTGAAQSSFRGITGGRTGNRSSQGADVPFIKAPSWAWEPLWNAAVDMAGSIGKLGGFIEAVDSGAYRSNAGLLNGIAQNRSKWNWKLLDQWPTVRDMIDMMLPLGQGMSGQEVADYFGLLKKGGILPGDGLYYGHAGEAVIPLPKGGGIGQATTVIFNGPVLGTEEQLTRKIIEGIRREQVRGAPSITRGR